MANIQRDDAPHKPEECIIEIPLILLVIETGVGYYTSPMLMLDTKMNAHVNDWSQQVMSSQIFIKCFSNIHYISSR